MDDVSAPKVYEHLSAVRQFSAEAAGSFELTDTLFALERVLVQKLSIPGGVVLSYSADTDTLSLLHQWGLGKLREFVNTDVEVPDHAWFELAQSPFVPERSFVGDNELLTQLLPEMREPPPEYPYVLFLPILARNQLKGILGLFSTYAGEVHSPVYQLLALQFGSIWEQADLDESSRRDRDQLRQILRQIILRQEEERLRVSRELHDEAGQLLTALKLSLEMGLEDLEALLEGDATAASALDGALTSALNLTEQTLKQVQGLIHEMRPSALDDLGLVTALDSYVRDFGQRNPNLSISFHRNDIVRPRLSRSAEITMYRFLQEVLENVLDDSQVDQIQVMLRVEGDHLCLAVSENGSGFSPEAYREGLGLQMMRERLHMEDGRLEVRTDRRERSTLLAFVPIQFDQ